MRAWSTAGFPIPLPVGHRFPMAKYAMIRDGVIARGLLAPGQIHEPDPASWATLALTHTPRYLHAVLEGTLTETETRRLGFPWSTALRERSLRTAQGTLEAARDALEGGAGLSLAGGTHHAHADHGEGYCCLNDVAVAIRGLQREGRIRRAAVVDLDVHQGNGTAAIFAGDEAVFTFSMHGANNYPFRKASSTLDVELADGLGDAEYRAVLPPQLDRALADPRPDLVFYLAGADPYAGDRLGRLSLSIEGLRRRDRLVFDACRARALPVVVVMAGGYAANLEDLVTIHGNTVAELRRAYG